MDTIDVLNTRLQLFPLIYAALANSGLATANSVFYGPRATFTEQGDRVSKTESSQNRHFWKVKKTWGDISLAQARKERIQVNIECQI